MKRVIALLCAAGEDIHAADNPFLAEHRMHGTTADDMASSNPTSSGVHPTTGSETCLQGACSLLRVKCALQAP
jgi:hypothetical protein